jgi:hypothetical protein
MLGILDRRLFAAVHESAYGTKRTLPPCRTMSAFGSEADIANCPASTEVSQRVIAFVRNGHPPPVRTVRAPGRGRAICAVPAIAAPRHARARNRR